MPTSARPALPLWGREGLPSPVEFSPLPRPAEATHRPREPLPSLSAAALRPLPPLQGVEARLPDPLPPARPSADGPSVISGGPALATWPSQAAPLASAPAGFPEVSVSRPGAASPLPSWDESPSPPGALAAPPQSGPSAPPVLAGLLERLVRSLEAPVGVSGQPSPYLPPRGPIDLVYDRRAFESQSQSEVYPTASPSFNTGSRAGLRGAGGYGFGSHPHDPSNWAEPGRRRM